MDNKGINIPATTSTIPKQLLNISAKLGLLAMIGTMLMLNVLLLLPYALLWQELKVATKMLLIFMITLLYLSFIVATKRG